MKTGYVRRLGPGPDPVRPQGPVHQAAGPGPYLHGAGPTISGPDPRTSLWGPVRSEVRKGQDRTADSLFTSGAFTDYLEHSGTARHLTVHDSPASNGAAKRAKRTHLDGARAMME